MIAFVDESGIKDLCHCVSIGVVLFPQRKGVSYMELGAHLVKNIKRLLGIGGELKWIEVRRRGDPEVVMELISRVTDVRHGVFHFEGRGQFMERLRRLVEGAAVVVADNQLMLGPIAARVIERDSRRVPGIQLADVVAGYARSKLC